jgi:hypothetical protein
MRARRKRKRPDKSTNDKPAFDKNTGLTIVATWGSFEEKFIKQTLADF